MGPVRLDQRRLHVFPHTLSGEAFVYETTSALGEPVRVLECGGVLQSAVYVDPRRTEPPFAYQRAFDLAFDLADGVTSSVRRVLVLGGGGFSWPRHVVATHPGAHVDVAELDPAMVSVARRHFHLAEAEATGRLSVRVCDARAFLEEVAERAEQASGQDSGQPPEQDGNLACAPYDVVVNDTFAGSEPVLALATLEAATLVRRVVGEGIYLMNVVSRDGGRDLAFLRDEVATLKVTFAHVWVVPCTDEGFPGEDNYLLVATDSAPEVPDAVPYDEEFLGHVLRDDDGGDAAEFFGRGEWR